jgi:hypothetical protein
MVDCTVIVNGYTDGKFSADRATFAVSLLFVPTAGDELELHPGPTWGVVNCVVERRRITPTEIIVITRVK